MRKNILTLCMALAMALSASAAFADNAVPEHPCVKPEPASGAALSAYESCMAAFISDQKQYVDNHQTAIRKAEAAMEQPQPELGGK